MSELTLTERARALENQLKSILLESSAERKLINALKRDIADARLDVRDFEYAETKIDQVKSAKDATKRLKRISENILAASQQNTFSPVDVAMLSAEIDRIIEAVNQA